MSKRTIAEQLEDLAAGMEETIKDKFRPRLENTRKRANDAASIRQDGYNLLRLQKTLRALATHHRAGTLPEVLQKVTSKALVERLLTYNHAPIVRLYKYGVEDLEQAAAKASSKDLNYLVADLRADLAAVTKDPAFIDLSAEQVKRLRSAYKGPTIYGISQQLTHAAAAMSAGIYDRWEEAAAALRSLPADSEDDEELKKRQAEAELASKIGALAGLKIAGYFPTPEKVAEEMVKIAGVSEGDRVLEPSAGSGRLADAARRMGAVVDCVEVSGRLVEILQMKGHKVRQTDFMDLPIPPAEDLYDVVLMNPPFENAQDAEHVQRAYRFVKPGEGVLVAIVCEGLFFRQGKKESTFRAWLEDVGAGVYPLPADTFTVRTRLVVIYPPAPKQNAKFAPFQSIPATIPAQPEPVSPIVAPEPEPVAALEPEMDPGLGDGAPAQRALFWAGAGQKPSVSEETAAWLAKQKGGRLLL